MRIAVLAVQNENCLLTSERQSFYTSHRRNLAEENVNFIAKKSIINAMTLEEVKIDLLKAKMIQKVIELRQNGEWF